MQTTSTGTDLITSVQPLHPLIAEEADAAEKARRVSTPVIEALAKTGAFHAFIPRALGGSEIDLPNAIRLYEDISIVDGSTGWVTMIGSTNGIISAFVAEDDARKVFGDGPGVVTAGVVAPRGKAVTEDGGYRVNGRWPFASGCDHAAWLALVCLVETDGKLETIPDGSPDLRMMILPASDVQIVDTWHVSGLRATGSHDVAVSDAFVPRELTFSFILGQPVHSGPLYRFPQLALFSAVVASVGLGIARGALDEIREIVPNRTPFMHQAPMSEWGYAQREYSRAEAALRSARGFLFEAVGDAWQTLEQGNEPTTEQLALVRLASSHAVQASVQAVDGAYNLGGGSAIYETSGLQRRFRDIHTLTQHFLIAPATFETAGRALFGLPMPPGSL
jgi:alkylation response protein AidB-like acyl-CoA dehydrogenase